jgi:hypothetical protein
MEMVTVGPVMPEALEREIAAACELIAGDKLVLLYLPIDADHAGLLAAARRGSGSRVVGMTTGGTAFTERGATVADPVAAVIGGTEVRFDIEVARRTAAHDAGSVEEAGRRLLERSTAGQLQSVLALADAYAWDGDVLVDALRAAVPPHWRLFGGMAGDAGRFRGTRVFLDDEVLADACVLVALSNGTPPSIASVHADEPLPGSRVLRVTGSEHNRVTSLDGRVAADVLRGELERLGLLRAGEDLLPVASAIGLRTMLPAGVPPKIRMPIGITDDGAIVLPSGLPPGSSVELVIGDADRSIAAAQQMATLALARLDNPPRASFVFESAAHDRALGDRHHEHVAALLAGGVFPCIGVACYGEIAKFGGHLEGFHSSTLTMVVF